MDAMLPSRAKAFFDKIKEAGNGATFLTKLVDSDYTTYESEFLDFKGGREIQSENQKLATLWGKNLSCFANSDGGVVIFGIDAPKGTAKGLSLVEDVSGIHSRLKELLPRVTEPPVQRVEIEPYECPPGSNRGFIVCYIPASPWRPHQAKDSGQPGHFYIRAADNCVPCSVSMLRSLFVPQSSAILKVYYKVNSRLLHNGQKLASLDTWIVNSGPSTASEVFIKCEFNDFTPENTTLNRTFWNLDVNSPHLIAFSATRSIHPDQKVNSIGVSFGSCDFSDWKRDVLFIISAKDQTPLRYSISTNGHDVKSGREDFAGLIEKIN